LRGRPFPSKIDGCSLTRGIYGSYNIALGVNIGSPSMDPWIGFS
jgi:hypothetical protein